MAIEKGNAADKQIMKILIPALHLATIRQLSDFTDFHELKLVAQIDRI